MKDLLPPSIASSFAAGSATSAQLAVASAAALGLGAAVYNGLQNAAGSSEQRLRRQQKKQIDEMTAAVIKARMAAREIQMKEASNDPSGEGSSEQLKRALLAADTLEKELDEASRAMRRSTPSSSSNNDELPLYAMREAASGQEAAAKGALDESRRKVALLEAMVTALRDRLREEEGKNMQLQAEVISGRDELERSEGLRTELEAKSAQLRLELIDAQGRLAKAEAASKVLELRVNELSAYSSRLETKVKDLERDSIERESRASKAALEAEGRVRELQRLADDSQSMLEVKQQQLVEAELEMEAMRERLREAEEREGQGRKQVAMDRSARSHATEEAMRMYSQKAQEVEALRGQMRQAQEANEASHHSISFLNHDLDL